MISRPTSTPLSAYDQSLGLGTSVVRVLSYRYMPDAERLNFALRRALERFPQFATALARAARGSFELVSLSSPQALILRSPVSWDHELITAEDLPLFVAGMDTVPGEPVFTATLTPVGDGAVLGISMSHAIGDAYSFYLFLSYWAEQFALAPQSSRSASQRSCPSACPSAEVAQITNGREHSRQVKRVFSVLDFEQEFLESLRTELATDQFVPTINEALTAFLLHRHGSKIMGGATELRLRVPVNVRKVHPKINNEFIGNAFLEAIVPVDGLINSPSAARGTAKRIREAVAGVRNEAYLESVLQLRHNRVELSAKDLPIFNRQTDIISTNYTKMPLHTLDLGSGPPARIFCVLAAPAGFVIVPTFNGLQAHIVSEHGRISETP